MPLNPLVRSMCFAALATVVGCGGPPSADVCQETVQGCGSPFELPASVTPAAPSPSSPPAPAGVYTLASGGVGNLRIDATGGEHVITLQDTGIVYAYCPGNCTSAAAWTSTLIRAGSTFGDESLSLDPSGHPRASWSDIPATGSDSVYFATCDVDCTSASSWSALRFTNLSLDEYGEDAHLVVDETGRVDIAVTQTLDWYLFSCPGNCSVGTSWSISQKQASIIIDSFSWAPGGVRAMILSDVYPVYVECRDGCADAANWPSETGAPAFEMSMGGVVGFDPTGRVHVAGGDTNSQVFGYFSCSSNCMDPSSWSEVDLPSPTINPEVGELVFDASGRPVFSETSDVDGEAGVYACSANCESSNATWNRRIFETPDAYPDTAPPAPFALALWSISTSCLALDATGAPHVAFRAYHTLTDNSANPPYSFTDQSLVRLAE